MKYIKEQFDFRYCRQDYVSSEYKTQNRLEYDDNNDSLREENHNERDFEKFDTDDEIGVETDNNIFNCNQKEASYYKQECP